MGPTPRNPLRPFGASILINEHTVCNRAIRRVGVHCAYPRATGGSTPMTSSRSPSPWIDQHPILSQAIFWLVILVVVSVFLVPHTVPRTHQRYDPGYADP